MSILFREMLSHLLACFCNWHSRESLLTIERAFYIISVIRIFILNDLPYSKRSTKNAMKLRKRLEKLKQFRDSNLITEQEYEKKKSDILNEL